MGYYDYDFIGFTYGGKHSYRDLKIYRTSNGNRYETNLFPTLKDNTASVPGQVGQYYFGTEVEQKQFNISFAFDALTEGDIRKLKQTFNGKELQPLIFDEEPYKVYSAKVTGSSVLKHLCFEEKGQRIYKGEGSLQLVCYYPYAKTNNTLPKAGAIKQDAVPFAPKYLNRVYTSGISNIVLDCGVIVETDKSFTITIPDFIDSSNVSFISKLRIYYSLLDGTTSSATFSQNGSAYIPAQEYTIAAGTLSKTPTWALISRIEYVCTKLSDSEPGLGTNINLKGDFGKAVALTQDGVRYWYTANGCFENESIANTQSAGDGRIINHYAITLFPNKFQWAQASGLPLHTNNYINSGDIACPFKLSFINSTEQDISIKLPSMTNEIAFSAPSGKIVWDTSTGLVTADDKILPVRGDSCFALPVGAEFSQSLPLQNLTYTYNLIYY